MTAYRRPSWTVLRTWFKPPRTLKVTPAGRTYLVLTVGIGLAALNTGNNMLFLVLGLLLSAIVVSGVLSERCLRYLEVQRLLPEAAFAGHPFALRWAVKSSRPAFALKFREEGPGLTGEGTLAYLAAGSLELVRGRVSAARRGPHLLAAIRVTTTFPFGLFAKTRIFSVNDTLLVFPRRLPSRDLAEPLGRRLSGEHGNALAEGTGEVIDFRDLEAGEDARRVNWRKTAALGRLVRTVREREEGSTYVLRVPAETPSQVLERKCESAAAAAHLLIARGGQVGLEADGVRLPPATGPAQERRILIALGWVGFRRGHPP